MSDSTEAVRGGVEGLEAGRELDALVAVRVMGWGHTHDIDYVEGDPWYSSCRQCGETGASGGAILDWEWGDAPLPGCPVPPSFSTDIATAWRVVEKMRAAGYATIHVSCGCDIHGVPVPGWYASFFQSAAIRGASATADTAPLAICRAALAATTTHPTSKTNAPEPSHDSTT